MEKRKDHEPPPVVSRLGWKYHHLGIPYEKPRDGEKYLQNLKIYVSGFDTSPYGIEWMRFEEGCGYPELLTKVPHIAFEVGDIEEAIKGKEILYPVSSPSEGVRSAMIIDNGALIELIEFRISINS